MPRPFQLVDVFAGEPFLGNPLAVVHDADGLSTEEMQLITRWLNLSEVGSSRVDLQACKLEYSIVSPK